MRQPHEHAHHTLHETHRTVYPARTKIGRGAKQNPNVEVTPNRYGRGQSCVVRDKLYAESPPASLRHPISEHTPPQGTSFGRYFITLMTITGMKASALLITPAVFILFGFAYADDSVVILNTEHGRLVFEFFPEDAPNHVNNFVTLAGDGFYTNTIFHRIIPGFMIQGGDPNTVSGDESTWGTGGPPHTLDAEFNDIMHNRGILSMARSTDPNSAGSQFFIVHQDSGHLDGAYTVFGRLATHDSFDTLDSIANTATSTNNRPLIPDGVRILSVEVTTRNEAISLGIPIIDQNPPTRTGDESLLDGIGGGAYTNDELNLTIQFPEGWIVQHLEGEGLPDVVAISTTTSSALPTSIAVYVDSAGNHTFSNMVEGKIRDVQEHAEAGNLIIENQELSALGEREAFVADVSLTETISDTDVKMREVTVMDLPTNTIYTFLFSTSAADFERSLVQFDEALQTFDTIVKPQTTAAVTEQETTTTTEQQTDTGGGCLIATAAFGSEMAPQVQQLREIRDKHITQTTSGSDFIASFNTLYYTFSPTISDYQRENAVFRDMIKHLITPTINALSVLEYAPLDTEERVLAYGSLTIILVVFSYIGPSAFLMYGARRLHHIHGAKKDATIRHD